VAKRQERRRKQLVGNLKEITGYWELKEKALPSHSVGSCFGRAYGSVVRLGTE
jgi:hypothetical protein